MFYVKSILIFLIYIYKCLISSCMKPHCRFYPTCSEYSIEVLKNFGILKSIFLIIKRIMKCHPLSRGGIDEVPLKFENNNNFKEY